MKIYTRKGDSGHTSLIDGDIVNKHNLSVDAYGTIDELNSFLGLLRVLEINNCYSSVTGAKKDHCSGKIYNP